MKLSKRTVDAVLENWVSATNYLKKASVDEVEQLLEAELAGRRRASIAARLLTRARRLRLEAERQALLRELKSDRDDG